MLSKRFDCSSSGTCQNPLFASSLLKTLPCPSFERLSSTVVIGCTSCLTPLFSCVRSAQIRTLPFAFGTQTIPEHHSVETVTGEIILCLSIDSILALTFSNMGWGTFPGLYRQTRTASSRIVIWYSVLSFPSPLNSCGNSFRKSGGEWITSPTSFNLIRPNCTQGKVLVPNYIYLFLDSTLTIFQVSSKSANHFKLSPTWASKSTCRFFKLNLFQPWN